MLPMELFGNSGNYLLTYNLSPKVGQSTKVIKSRSRSPMSVVICSYGCRRITSTRTRITVMRRQNFKRHWLTGYQPPPSRYYGANIAINF